jgi:hypothetical protein
MKTLGTTPSTTILIEETYGLNIGFVMSTGTPQRGMLVKMDTTGTVSPVTAATQRPVGVIVSAYDKNAEANSVRVATPFQQIVRMKFAAAINAGVEVAATGFDTTDNVPTGAAAVTGNIVSGVVLQRLTASAGIVEVGILRTPYVK